LYVAMRFGVDVLHAHNPPDTLFLVGIPLKLLGKKFIFDHHDLAPELYQSRYRTRGNAVLWGLLWAEKCSLKLADITIATNESYKQVHIQRGGRRPERCFVVRNGPGRDRMDVVEPSKRLRQMGKSILCYIGCLNPQDGVDYLLRALAHLTFDLKRTDYYCVIMGSGDSLEDLRKMNRELRLEKHVEFTGYIPEADLRANLSAADICLDPETRYSAREAAIYVEPNNERSFAFAIAQLMDDPVLRERMGGFGRTRVEETLQWSRVGPNLAAAYRALFPGRVTQGDPSYPSRSNIEESVSR
jgi:glycosyltransferase involved in cell wall biosynthesis